MSRIRYKCTDYCVYLDIPNDSALGIHNQRKKGSVYPDVVISYLLCDTVSFVSSRWLYYIRYLGSSEK